MQRIGCELPLKQLMDSPVTRISGEKCFVKRLAHPPATSGAGPVVPQLIYTISLQIYL